MKIASKFEKRRKTEGKHDEVDKRSMHIIIIITIIIITSILFL